MGGGVVTGALVGAVLAGVALAAISIALPVRPPEPEAQVEVALVPQTDVADDGSAGVETALRPEEEEDVDAEEPAAVAEIETPVEMAPASTVEALPPEVVDMAPEPPADPAEPVGETEVVVVAEPAEQEAPEPAIRPQAREVASVPAFPEAAPEPAADEAPQPSAVVAEPVQPASSGEAEEVVVRSVPIDPVIAGVPGDAPEAPVAEAAPAAPDALPEPDVIVIADVPETDEAEAAGETAGPDLPPEGPALEVAAIGFEPTARPAMGIVLEDVGELPDPDAVTGLPFPLVVIIDPAREDAAERMTFWREAGAEIALSADLPSGASAGDAATLLDAWRRAVPWAVAAVEDVPGEFQGAALRQVLSGLAESGHGILLHSRGLNSARAEAEREGVPAGLIFRDIDGAGETPVIIRRFLDQAAFRASRNDGVILKGRTTPETIETIRDWSLEGRGRTVAIAPLSAMLPREAD